MFRRDADRFAFLLEAEASLIEDAAENPEVDILTAQAAAKRPKYVTNYIGSKQKLIEWIWRHTPDEAETVVDAFSGSSVVGYMYKLKGLSVHSNDRLHYCYHASRAIVENDMVTLSDDELDELLADNSKAGDFVRTHFRGLYFASGVHKIIDTIRANINDLAGFKRDIALFALGKTCISGQNGFGHFNSTQKYGRGDGPSEFKMRFLKNARRINELVFEGEAECKAHHGDVKKVIKAVKADAAYFDPPYATHFSQTNYEKAYHFVEGLMTYWKGKKIDEESKTKSYEVERSITKSNAAEFFKGFLDASDHIDHWLISYRDQAYPEEKEIKTMIRDSGRDCSMKTKVHKYQLGGKHGDNSTAKERLFVCSPSGCKTKAKASTDDDELKKVSAQTININHEAEPSTEDDEFDCDAGEVDIYGPDVLTAIAGAKSDDAVRLTAYMGNKYFIIDWIWRNSPKGAESVLDAFSGGANVAYYYKRKGLRVVTNDKLDYPYRIARAFIENNAETLSDAEIEKLFETNSAAGSFVVDNFYGYYYTKPILAFLDNVYANIQKLKGYKKDLALAALGWTVVTKAKFGQFSRSKKTGRDSPGKQTSLGDIPLSTFTDLFRRNLAKANELVYDNGKKNEVLQTDSIEAVKGSKTDLIYADPPYITQFGNNDYESEYHFVEGLMTMWRGKKLLDNTLRSYESSTKFTKESIAELIKGVVDGCKADDLLLSYRDKAYPEASEIKGYFKERFKDVAMRSVKVEYGYGKKSEDEEGGRYAKELLFIGSGRQSKALQSSKADVVLRVNLLEPSAADPTDLQKRLGDILNRAYLDRRAK